ncbi:MAG: PAS domain S-box protein, partial [Burkholderiaceae bacterium]
QHFLGNRYFDLYASTTPEFEAQFSRKVVWLAATSGGLLTLMAAGWVFVLTRNSQRQDRQMTRLGADNERLAGVVKSATNLVVITDPQGCITWVNPAFETLTGYTMAEVAGFKPGALLQCEETDATTIAQLSQAIRAREPIQTEILNQAKDGTRYWVLLSIQPQWAADGALKGFMAIEQDVTQRRQAQAQMEAAMRETAALMGTINLHAIVSQTDKRGIITHANQAFVDISGYSQDELVGRSHNIVNSGYHPSTYWQSMWATIRSGQPWHGVVCNRNKGGEVYWVDTLVAPFLDADGHIERYVSIRTDITARMQAQRALERTQRDLELSNQVARIGTWELDVTQDRMTWSAVTRELYQVPPDFVISRQAALRFFPEGPVRENARAAMRQALDTGAGWDIEQQLLTFTGEPIWVRSIAVTEMEGDRCVRVYGTFQDITERKQRELEMAHARLTL